MTRYDLLTKLGFSLPSFLSCLEYLPTKIDQATDRIRNSPFDLSSTYVGHSGGKDSVLVHWLANRVQELPVVHTPKYGSMNNAVHPLTAKFLYEQDFVIQYVPASKHSSLNFKTQIDGTRIAEADRTDGRSTTFVRNGTAYPRTELTEYVENSLFGLNFIYPIYDWSDLEVWTAILSKEIPFSPEYCL